MADESDPPPDGFESWDDYYDQHGGLEWLESLDDAIEAYIEDVVEGEY